MEDLLEMVELSMEEAIANMEKKFLLIRAGRANPAILDCIVVEYYGTPTPVKQLANISIPEARQLMIKPFDRSCIGNIEKAIYEAKLGITPTNNGETIIMNIPALTEDTRRDYVKQVKQLAEEGRIDLRNIRQDNNNKIKKSELTEDDQEDMMNEVQKLIDSYNKVIDEKLKIKETELMSI